MAANTPEPIRLRQPGAGRILVRCMGYLRSYWPYVAGAYAMLVARNAITLAVPLIIRWVVDEGISVGEQGVIRRGTLALLGLTVLRGLSVFTSGRWTETASQNVAYDLRNAIHEKLQSLSFSYHDRTETGQLLARAVGDVDRVRFLSGRAVMHLIEVTVLIIGVAISMVALNARLAALTLVIVPFMGYAAFEFGRRFRPLFRLMRGEMDALTTRLEQNLRGARIVKAFAQQRAEIARFDEQNTRVLDLNVHASRMRATSLPLLQLFASAGTIVVLLHGGRLAIDGRATCTSDSLSPGKATIEKPDHI